MTILEWWSRCNQVVKDHAKRKNVNKPSIIAYTCHTRVYLRCHVSLRTSKEISLEPVYSISEPKVNQFDNI